LRVLDLRSESTLDALGLDDRVSTGHEQPVWDAAQQLTDRVLGWWGDAVHGLLYRSRTTPGSSANIAFFARAPLRGRSRTVASSTNLLNELITAHGFTVDF
jgi:hypothetical protein